MNREKWKLVVATCVMVTVADLWPKYLLDAAVIAMLLLFYQVDRAIGLLTSIDAALKEAPKP